ncbi:MAG: hypothetical protein KDD59_09275 [Bdellovibrionales bacterium]|nr:hypothetical protein [Bdellovibrionales bacterium]
MTSQNHLCRWPITLLLALLISFALTTEAMAAVITSVQGNAVKISKQRTKIKKGQTVSIYNKKGRIVGKAKITWAGSKTAKGTLLSNSQAKKGYQVKISSSRGKRDVVKGSDGPSNSKMTKKMLVGFMGGYTITDMQVTLATTSATVDMGGNGYGAKVLFDYGIMNNLWFRGMVGLENFSAGGVNNSGCTGGAECNVNIDYLAFDFWGRYLIMNGNFRPWLGLGFSFLMPMSKSSTAIKDSSIGNTNVFGGGLGFDWIMSEKMSIPVHLEYGLLPSSEKVKANYIAIRAGIAYAF